MKPIPRSLMPDVLSVRVPAEGTYGGEYEEPVTITGVRFEPKLTSGDGYIAGKHGGTIFIDAVNSVGAFELPAGSRVRIGGDRFGEMTVRETKVFEDYNGHIHHWEVTVE